MITSNPTVSVSALPQATSLTNLDYFVVGINSIEGRIWHYITSDDLASALNIGPSIEIVTTVGYPGSDLVAPSEKAVRTAINASAFDPSNITITEAGNPSAKVGRLQNFENSLYLFGQNGMDRLYLGKPGSAFYSVNFASVSILESVPVFSTTDQMNWGTLNATFAIGVDDSEKTVVYQSGWPDAPGGAHVWRTTVGFGPGSERMRLTSTGVLQFTNTSSLGSVTGGARIGAIAGEMNVLDSSGNVTVISPHAKDAPAWLYEVGPGADNLDRKANLYLGTVTWWNVDRRKAIDKLDMTARLGSPEASAAAWAQVFSRQQNNRFLCEAVETFTEYETRTGTPLWPGETPEDRAAYAALSPAARWDFNQAAHLARSVAARTAWEQRQSAHETSPLPEGETERPPFTEPEPELYFAVPAPDWLQ